MAMQSVQADSTKIWAATLSSTGQAFFAAPLGTTLPTDAYTDLAAEFLDLGWMGDDGFTNAPKRTTKKVKAFGGTVVKSLQTDYAETVKATCMETNPSVLKTMFGVANVTVGSNAGHRTVSVNHSALVLPRQSFVVQAIEATKVRRLVVMEGQISEISDIKWTESDVLRYTFTIDCFIPAGQTVAVKEYMYEPDVSPGS